MQHQEATYKSPAVQELLNDTYTFDVAVVTVFGMDIGMYLAKECFQAPVILYSHFRRSPYVDIALGNPVNPSFVPMEDMVAFGNKLSFKERFINTFYRLLGPTLMDVMYYQRLSREAQKLLELEEPPNTWGMMRDVDFAFFNNHIAFEGSQPVVPGSIDISGLHLGPVKPLPTHIKEWLDGAKHGAILVAFGSVRTMQIEFTTFKESDKLPFLSLGRERRVLAP